MEKYSSKKIYSGIDNSNREKIRSKLGSTPFYKILKKSHKVYCKLTSNFHQLPDFLIIGAAKSGTSSLYEYLTHHPSILPCVVKEPNYFTTYYHRGIDWYKSCFPYKINEIKYPERKFLTGEATARYYWYPYAAERAYELLPNAKIILLLREPVQRAFSHYKMRFKNGIISNSFETEIEDESNRLNGEWEKMLENKSYFSYIFNSNGYVTKGLYINYIKKWYEFFPNNQIKIINSKEFFNNPEKITNSVLEFLNLNPIKLDKYEVMRKGLDDKIDPQTSQKLKELFRPYNEKLFKFINEDFGWND